eukprot:scaffold23682_cov61-Phaeocystis_antarctica.AAC.3
MASSGFALSLPSKSGCHASCVIMPHAASMATRPCFSSASRYLAHARGRARAHARFCARRLSLAARCATLGPAASATRPALPPCTGSMSARSLLHRLRAGVLGEAERIKVRQRRAVANQAAHLHLHSHTAGRWAHQHRGRRKGSYPARKRGTRKKSKPAAASCCRALAPKRSSIE